jgi:tetratricopeptide (TPR) repeat protein
MVHILGLSLDTTVLLGVLVGTCLVVAAAVRIAYALRLGGRRERTAGADLSVIRRDMDRLAQYLDGLPESEPVVRNLFRLGLSAMEACKWDQALEHFHEALIAAKGTELVALFNLSGTCQYTLGRLDDALGDFEEAARLAKRFGDEQGKAPALGNMGVVCHDRGELDKALHYKNEALEKARVLGDQWAEAIYLGNIGTIWHDKGELDKALACHEEALAMSREIGDEWGVASDLVNIASIYRDKGGFDQALKYDEESLATARKIGYRLGVATDLNNIGVIYSVKGGFKEALRFEEEALRIAREIGFRLGVATDLGNIGLILTAQKKYEPAVPRLAEALAIMLDAGVADGPRQALTGLVRCENVLGRERVGELLRKVGLDDKALADLLDRKDQMHMRRPGPRRRRRSGFPTAG